MIDSDRLPIGPIGWFAVVSYPFRRLLQWLFAYGPSCQARWCARPRVGFSVWCRCHTDEIILRPSRRSPVR